MSTTDYTERLLNALEESTRVSAETKAAVQAMEREFVSSRESTEKEFDRLRESFSAKMHELEMEMRTTNAHLDNLVRATEVTNELLREDMEDRRRQQEHRLKLEAEDLKWKRSMETRQLERKEEVEDDNRNIAKKYLDEGWAVFKQPFAYLIAGVVFWLLIRYFSGVPPQQMMMMQPQPSIPVQVGEQGEP